MSNATPTLEQVLALRDAVAPVLEALMPLRNAHHHSTEMYTAFNRIINEAVDVAEQAANAYVDAHIIPAPQNPSPAFIAKMAAVKEDLEDRSHQTWQGDFPANLTGRIYISISGGTWYELAADDELNGTSWVSSEVPVDPKGWSTRWEHVAHDVRGAIL